MTEPSTVPSSPGPGRRLPDERSALGAESNSRRFGVRSPCPATAPPPEGAAADASELRSGADRSHRSQARRGQPPCRPSTAAQPESAGGRANSTALRSRNPSPSAGATHTRHGSERSLMWTSRTTQHRPLPSTVASLDSRPRLHAGSGSLSSSGAPNRSAAAVPETRAGGSPVSPRYPSRRSHATPSNWRTKSAP